MYQNLIQHRGYVIALCSEFSANVSQEELDRCLYADDDKGHKGLFRLFPSVSGILFFENARPGYHFTYIASPESQEPFDLPNGKLVLPL